MLTNKETTFLVMEKSQSEAVTASSMVAESAAPESSLTATNFLSFKVLEVLNLSAL